MDTVSVHVRRGLEAVKQTLNSNSGFDFMYGVEETTENIIAISEAFMKGYVSKPTEIKDDTTYVIEFSSERFYMAAKKTSSFSNARVFKTYKAAESIANRYSNHNAKVVAI